MKRIFVSLMFVLSTSATASATECDPAKFSLKDYERLKFSDSLALSVIDTMEQGSSSDSKAGLSIGMPIHGVPVKLSGSDARSASEYMKRNSSLSFSHEQQIDYLRSNVSLVGADMYRDCLKRGSENFSIEVPAAAYSEDDFFVQIRWTPTYSIADRLGRPAAVQLRVLNGTIDGANKVDAVIEDKKTIGLAIHRTDRTKSLQIIPTVDGYGNGDNAAIYIPPIVHLQFTTRLREWTGKDEKPFLPVCSDDGGGVCGQDRKDFIRCIYASDDGMLLPSTFAYEIDGRVARPPELMPETDASRVCVKFGTFGLSDFGHKGSSSLNLFRFAVREIIPLKPAQ